MIIGWGWIAGGDICISVGFARVELANPLLCWTQPGINRIIPANTIKITITDKGNFIFSHSLELENKSSRTSGLFPASSEPELPRRDPDLEPGTFSRLAGL